MPKTAANPDDTHAIALLEELIQPNPLHLVNQGTEPFQILHQKKRENARVLLQLLGRTEHHLVTSVSKVPSTGDLGKMLLLHYP